jgi:hypothetical protein
MDEDALGSSVGLGPGDLSGHPPVEGGEQLGSREVRARVRGWIGVEIRAGEGNHSRGRRVGGDGAFASRFVATSQVFQSNY